MTTYTPEFWETQQAQAAQQKVLEQNRVLRLDGEALDAQAQCDTAFKLSGQGPAPEPAVGQSGAEYQRMCVSRLKGCAGLQALVTDDCSDGAVKHLMADCVEKVGQNWQRPPDVPAGQLREVVVRDRTGREATTVVVGKGTPSAFRALYSEFLSPGQIAVSFRGRPIQL